MSMPSTRWIRCTPRAIGVDIDQLLISQPDTGEQALEIADMLVRSGALDVVVIDSVAALTPRAEIEGEMGDTTRWPAGSPDEPGVAQAHRQPQPHQHHHDLHQPTARKDRRDVRVLQLLDRVTLADGTQEKIGKLVNRRMPVEVLSYDADLDRIVAKPITNWFDNGVAERFLQFKVARGGGNGAAQFAATENHLISTPGGWRSAGELVAGDRVMQSVPHYLSDMQWQVVLGGLMGDGALSPTSSGNGARFRWGHGAKQVAYGDWKASLFANINVSRHENAKGAVFFDCQPLPELTELRAAVYVAGKKVLSHDYLKQLTPLSLAVWYMDDAGFQNRSKGLQARTADGSGRAEICVEAMSADTRTRLQRVPRRHLGNRGNAHPARGAAEGCARVRQG